MNEQRVTFSSQPGTDVPAEYATNMLWYAAAWRTSAFGNYPPYSFGLLLTGGYMPAEYAALQSTSDFGINANLQFAFWCPQNPPAYVQTLHGTMGWGDLQNRYGLVAWKAYIGSKGLASSARGAASTYVVNTRSPRSVANPGRWALVWDYEYAPNLPSYYWLSHYGTEVLPRWVPKHAFGYNALFLDGHAKAFGDPNRELPQKYPCQGIPGNQNSWGVLRLKEYFETQ